MKFSELDLHPKLQENIKNINFVDCTPIQTQAIPLLLQGKDLAGLAQTGTGKTAAFLVPLIDRILGSFENPPLTRCFSDWKKRNCLLVLVPTRELADQVYENALKLIPSTKLSAVAIYGGTTYDKQKAALRDGVEIVIATPGRLIDLYKEHCFDMGQVRAIVFDEADRMFDMGFKDDMKFILRRVPRERQFLVFSATLNFDVLNVAYEFGADPVEINISRDQAKAENVKDQIFHVGQADKPSYLLSIMKKQEPRQAIIFSNFKRNVELLTQFLNKNGLPAMGISSLLTQAQRNRVMEQFKAENDRNILVATDLAARGLDILGVDLIVNYELPDDPENYVHRIGRTGRAGQEGQAFSLVSDRDVDALARIETYMKNKLESGWLDDQDIVKEFAPFPREEYGHRHSGGRSAGGGGGGGSRGPRRPPHPRDRDNRDRDRRPGGPPRRHDRDRAASADGPRRHEEGAPRRPQHQGQGSGSSHRDRRTGRHGSQGPSGPGHQGPRHSGSQHRQDGGGRRPQHQHGRRPLHSNGGPKRHSQGAQGNRAASPPAATAGIGGKVSGFFKRLFGKKTETPPAKPKSSTRNS